MKNAVLNDMEIRIELGQKLYAAHESGVDFNR